ncbi:MAG: transposase [Chitinispirillales bacterium]|nr:transposase [Chitinispirillales bacterium]
MSIRTFALGEYHHFLMVSISIIHGYRYTCYTTNLTLGALEVWRLYRGRANCENRIKELKYDYGLDKLNQAGFNGTEASLVLMTIAYNLMSLFRQVIMGDKIKQRLSTLRHKFLAIPSLIEKSTQKTVVKMALQMRRRSWIRKLWDNSMGIGAYKYA